MESETRTYGWGLWARWLLGTAVGWITGIIMSIVLSYFVVNLFYDKETNLIVGLVTGFFVGLAQVIAARGALPFSWRWIWGSSVGMGIPFIIATVIAEVRGISEDLDWVVVLLGVFGAAITGLLQMGVLKNRAVRPKCWVGANILSWGLIWLMHVLIGEPSFALGGLTLGAVSGAMLVWRVRIIR